MSCGFIKRVICIIAALAMLPAAVFAEADEFDVLRQRWFNYLTGGDYTQSGAVYTDYIKPKVTAIGNAGAKWQNAMADEKQFETLGYVFSDLQMGDTDDEYNRKARPMSETFERIEAMALAYKTKGSAKDGDKTLKNSILSALSYMYKAKYNENTPRTNRNLSPKNANENWYEWEIRAPESIVNILVLMYDDIDGQLLKNLIKAIDKQVPNIGAAATGANRLDNCQAQIIAGIAEKNKDRIAYGIDSVAVELEYSRSDDGFYEDGSFIQHHQYPYNGGYGKSALSSMANIVYLFWGSSFAPDNPNFENVYKWVEDSFDSLSYEGRMMDSVRGRGISSASDNGYGFDESLVILSEFAPKKYADYYKSILKRRSENNKLVSPYSQVSGIYSLSKLYDILNDDTVLAQEDKVFYKNFGAMDRAVAFRDNFAVNVSMYSDRIRNYESINGANLQGWHTASGALYLFNDDLDHYNDNYWATIDRKRIPGTTVAKNSTEASALYGDSFAGGVDLDGYYGANAMRYNAPDDADGGAAHNLTAQKSWFMLDDEIVCLGSGITSTNSDEIETIVENRKVDYLTQDLIIDGNRTDTASDWSDEIYNVSWAYMRGNSKNTAKAKRTDIGFYFPNGARISAKREKRTDSWKSIGTGPSAQVTKNYMSLAVNHGIAPTDDTYAYALLPGKTSSQVKSYASAPEFTVLANTKQLQAVEKPGKNLFGAVVWEAGANKVKNITLNTPMIMMAKYDSDSMELAFSDPTQKGVILKAEADGEMYPECADKGVGVTAEGGKTYITVNTSMALGKSFHVKLVKSRSKLVPPAPEKPVVSPLSPTGAKIETKLFEGLDYRLEFSENKDSGFISVDEFCEEEKTIQRNLTPGKTYYYRLLAANEYGFSDASEICEITMPQIPDSVSYGEIWDDFSGFAEGPLVYQNGWSVEMVGSAENKADIINGKLTLSAGAYKDSDSIKVSAKKSFERMSGKIVAEADFTLSDINWKNLIVLYSGTTAAVQVYANTGELWTYNGSTWKTKHTFKDSALEIGKSYHLCVIADTDTDMFSVYLDGRKLEYSVDEALTFRNKVSYIDSFECSANASRGEVSFESLKVHQRLTCLNAEIANGKVCGEYYNPQSQDILTQCFMCFKKNGQITEIKMCSSNILAGETAVFSEEIQDADTAEIYIWDQNQKPLAEKVSVK